MKWRNTDKAYGTVAQTLHWLIVIGLIASYFLAEAAEHDEASTLMSVHRSVGITILVLAVLRIVWRLADRRPLWPATMAGYERVIARATHWTFYALLFALPITGWMLSTAEGDAVRFFGLFELPPLLSPAGEELLEELHETLFNVLLAFAVLHIVGALKHHLWNRDNVLRSMLPAPGSRRHHDAATRGVSD
jgi:cytochrome b561